MTEVIVTGANGLIGSVFCDQLASSYNFCKLDISNPTKSVDITKADSIEEALKGSDAHFLVHFAAFTNVTAAWEQTDDVDGSAYQVNVVGTQNLVEICNQHQLHLIQISTAYVFDGEKPTPYSELDPINPIEWYGKTKALAEAVVQEKAEHWTILRIDQPFRPDRFTKLDLVHKIADDLRARTLSGQFTDHFVGPTWIPDFVKVIDWVLRTSQTGLFHASSGEQWSNFELAKQIQQIIGSTTQIQSSLLNEYLQSHNRPYQKNTALSTKKLIAQLDFELTPVVQALAQTQF